MECFLVTGKDSDREFEDGYGKCRKPSFSHRYKDILDEACVTYLRAGMSYEDFWDGPSEMAIYYRKKLEQDKEYDNFKAWLQGMYVYEAILDLVPVLRPFSKGEPIPFRDRPISLTEAEEREKKERENRRNLEAGRKHMEALAIALNKQLKNKEKGGEKNE